MIIVITIIDLLLLIIVILFYIILFHYIAFPQIGTRALQEAAEVLDDSPGLVSGLRLRRGGHFTPQQNAGTHRSLKVSGFRV